MTEIAFLWHMHQPYYEDLVTHEHILPWVRLHALKDYYGMVALLAEFPKIRMTFNLVPSLLVQLDAFAGNRARDCSLEVGLKPAPDLTEQDALFMFQNFFHAHPHRMIEIYPRYAELLARRGPLDCPGDVRHVLRRFTVDDLRDLQVWQKLAWIDPFYLDGDARIRGLLQKGAQFTEEDKRVLRTVELEILNRIVPAYRDRAASGQIELSTSPFYHPILPLLCDTDVYTRTHPDSRLPRQRFTHPEDAFEQLTRAAVYHEGLFGRRPAGLWPSEGSVSNAMVPLAARAGFSWMATDELILARSTGIHFTRDANGQLEQPEQLYRSYMVRVGDAAVGCAFRDHVLSDLIGFTYASWGAEAAAEDFVGRLVQAGRRFRERTGGQEAVIAIVLDGENAWEHFEGGGRPFLRALYRRLSDHPELRTVTMGEACGPGRGAPELSEIFPGSWIDANFYIWIGHRDDQLAWGQLADARRALDEHDGVDGAAAALAREEVLIAEGSDWFWWYGDDHSSEHDQTFDDLFRRHLRNAYRLLNKPVPDELHVSNITAGPAPAAQREPTALLRPTIDGEETSYFEWLGGGWLEGQSAAGAMHPAGRRPSIITLVRFGFDRERLYVRLDARRPVRELLAEGFEFSLKFLNPEGVCFTVRQSADGVTGVFWDERGEQARWVEQGPRGGRAAAGRVLEVELPLADLGGAGLARVSFFVAVSDRASREVERHPAQRPVEAAVGDPLFEARNWTA